jgi:hypothetical protein
MPMVVLNVCPAGGVRYCTTTLSGRDTKVRRTQSPRIVGPMYVQFAAFERIGPERSTALVVTLQPRE